MSTAPAGDDPSPQENGERVTFLDQALWAALSAERPGVPFATAWLTLQCRQLREVVRGVLVLRGPAGGMEPAVRWPDGDGGSDELSATVNLCNEHRRGIATVNRGSGREAGRTSTLAYPVLLDGELQGIVGIESAATGDAAARDLMRGLHWGTAWLELTLRRERGGDLGARLDRCTAALEILSVVLAARGFANQARAAATEIANRIGATRVGLGWVKRRGVKLVALSHGLAFSSRMTAVDRLAAAMDEAVDQARTVMAPAPAGLGALITRDLSSLLRSSGAGAALCVPLTIGERVVGAISVEFETATTLDQDAVDLIEAIAALIGPALDAAKAADRSLPAHGASLLYGAAGALLGRGRLALKLGVVAALAVIAFFAVYRLDYRLSGRATVEGLVRRTIAAAIDGYVASEHARAGESVRKGAVLASLDQTEFALQRLRWIAVRQQHDLEISKDLAAGQRADVNILRAQIDEANAQIALLDDEIARTVITAPFDGIVLSGDLSQSVGAPVQKAQVLFEIAPLDVYRVVIRVPDAEIGRVVPGQDGTLALASLPDQTFPFTVTRVTPVAEISEGQNAFRVEGRLSASSDRLRPNMEGVARIGVGRELLIWAWTHRLVAAVRLSLWSWWP